MIAMNVYNFKNNSNISKLKLSFKINAEINGNFISSSYYISQKKPRSRLNKRDVRINFKNIVQFIVKISETRGGEKDIGRDITQTEIRGVKKAG